MADSESISLCKKSCKGNGPKKIHNRVNSGIDIGAKINAIQVVCDSNICTKNNGKTTKCSKKSCSLLDVLFDYNRRIRI